MADIKGQVGELRMTLHITRKATGVTETVELIGKVTEDENGGDAQHGGEERGD